MTKMAAMATYDKNFKNLYLPNQKADDLETWYLALAIRVIIYANDDPVLTLTYLKTRSNLKLTDRTISSFPIPNHFFYLHAKTYQNIPRGFKVICPLSAGENFDSVRLFMKK